MVKLERQRYILFKIIKDANIFCEKQDFLNLIWRSIWRYFGMKEANKMLGKLMAVARHKNLTLILIAQNSAMLDVNVLRLTDILLLKEPSLLQTEFERKAMQKKYEKIKPFFKDKVNRESYFYVHGDEFQGFLGYELPDFWNESISKAFKNFR